MCARTSKARTERPGFNYCVAACLTRGPYSRCLLVGWLSWLLQLAVPCVSFRGAYTGLQVCVIEHGCWMFSGSAVPSPRSNSTRGRMQEFEGPT